MCSSPRFALRPVSLTQRPVLRPVRSFTAIMTLAAAFLLCYPVQAQEQEQEQAHERGSEELRVSPNAAVSQTIGTTEVHISYGRPSVRGRDIFGGLVPYDSLWRTGANEATTITFSDDVQIEGKPLEAGTYGLFTIPRRDAWTFVFNNNPEQWGAFNYDTSTDALRVQAIPEEAAPHEMMTFVFENVSATSGEAVLYWADVRVPFTITVDE